MQMYSPPKLPAAALTCDHLLCREQQFELHAKYSADSPIPEGFNRDIGQFMLGPPKTPAGGEKPKLKVLQLSVDKCS